MKCKATVFEHNKGVFHLGQCPECYQSNVINETESHSDIEAVEFHEWVGKQGYKLSHYEAKGGAIHLHESAGSKPFYELKPGDWLTTKELYQLFKLTPCTTNKHQ